MCSARAEVQLVSRATAVVTLSGEHDLATRRIDMIALERASERANVIVDLTRCTFACSTLTAMLFALRASQHQDERLELVVPATNGIVNRALRSTGVREVLPIHETLGSALDSVEHAAGANLLARNLRTHTRAVRGRTPSSHLRLA
jgi:anti-anti-sigma factor